MTLKEYIEQGFVLHDSDIWVTKQIRAFAKWWLELARNAIVVTGLIYLADKSNSVTLKVFAYGTSIVLLGYCMSHLNTWSFRFVPGIKHERINRVANAAAWGVISGCIFGPVIFMMVGVFQALLSLQPR